MPPAGYRVETAALIHLWGSPWGTHKEQGVFVDICQLNNVFYPRTSVV